MKVVRALVCGGRVGVKEALARIALGMICRVECWRRETLVIIEGGAEGYDTVAGTWADDFGITRETYGVNKLLDGEGDDAPKRRNTRMRLEGVPTCCVSFPGGPGTRNMWMQCFEAGLPVYDVSFADGRLTIHWMQKGQPSRLVYEGNT